MERMIRDQHKGDLRVDWRAEGIACEIILPVSAFAHDCAKRNEPAVSPFPEIVRLVKQ